MNTLALNFFPKAYYIYNMNENATFLIPGEPLSGVSEIGTCSPPPSQLENRAAMGQGGVGFISHMHGCAHLRTY